MRELMRKALRYVVLKELSEGNAEEVFEPFVELTNELAKEDCDLESRRISDLTDIQ